MQSILWACGDGHGKAWLHLTAAVAEQVTVAVPVQGASASFRKRILFLWRELAD